ncbi:MAG: lipopolysaccharide biosynthesis protein [Eubacteriales bacterium]|nr:lipopolysaccharide biosynthesis protein [Eubacteriales bacterium]
MAEQRQAHEKDMRGSVASGIFWKLLENGGDQLITFVISIVLARLLGPERYGTMALMLIFVAIGNVIIQTGFQTALIQKRKADDIDFSSVFFLCLIVAALLYLMIYLAAPFCAAYFGDAQIGPMLRVLSLILFFGAVVSVEIAYIARNMDFRKQCVATVLADLISGAAGIGLAFGGAGTWALVFQQLIKNICLAGILFALLPWRPKALFSLRRLSVLFSYGWKVLMSGLIDTIYNNLYTPVISRLYNPVFTGLYSRGNQFPQVIANAAAQTMQAVMLPAFSRTQDEKETLSAMLRRTVKMGSFLMFPMMAGLMATAGNLVDTLLGADWSGAVPYLALCALGYSVWPIHIANLQAINAQGRSDLYLKLELVKKALGLMVLFLSVRYGVFVMITLKSLMDFVCTVINAWPNRKLLSYGPLRQWRDVLPEFMISCVMGILVYLLPGGVQGLFGTAGGPAAMLLQSSLFWLCIQIAAGMVLYAGLAWVFRLESFFYLKEVLRGMRPRGAGEEQ